VSIIVKTARLAFLAGALALLTGCGKPSLDDAQKKISKFDAMSPQEALCNKNELGQFRSAVRQYAKASAAHGELWPDFSYNNNHPDDLTITVLAATYLDFMPARDLGRAGWHLGELQLNRFSGDATPDKSLLRAGKKYACEDLVELGYAVAEYKLSENYWSNRMVREGYMSNRPWGQKAELSKRAGKNLDGSLRRIVRLQRDLARAIDSAEVAQR
jgi:hypothetical protein